MEYYKLKTLYWYIDIHIITPREYNYYRPSILKKKEELIKSLAMTRTLLAYRRN